jgi:hypothetical protein
MALWPIFRPAGRRTRSSRTDQSMLVARALKIGQIADGGMPPTYETDALHEESSLRCILLFAQGIDRRDNFGAIRKSFGPNDDGLPLTNED